MLIVKLNIYLAEKAKDMSALTNFSTIIEFLKNLKISLKDYVTSFIKTKI